MKTELTEDHLRQIHNYLNQTNIKFGILVNFPKSYQTTLSIVIIFHNEEKETPEKTPWKSFTFRLPAVPNIKHKLEFLGKTLISID